MLLLSPILTHYSYNMVQLKKDFWGGDLMKKKFLSALLFSVLIFTVGCAQNESTTNWIPQILERGISVDDNEVLNYIPYHAFEENLMQEIKIFQKSLLSYYYVYDAKQNTDVLHIKRFDLDSDKLISEMELPIVNSYTTVVQVCNDQIVVSDAEKGILHIYDETLTEQKNYPISGDLIYVNPSITKAYCLTSTDGMHVVDLKTQDEQILLEHACDLSFYSFSENNLSVRYIDLDTFDKKECYAGLNLESGELEIFQIDDSFSGMEYDNGVWTSTLFSDKNTYFVGTQQEPYKFTSDVTYSSVQFGGNPANLILTETNADGTQILSAYNTDGTFLSSCSLSSVNGTFYSQPLWLEEANGYLFTVIDDTGHDQLYFWDFSESVAHENLNLISYYEKSNTQDSLLASQYYEQAEELSEKYGVTIKIAEQCEMDYSDKEAEQVLDPEQIENAFSVLERAFASYPSGFFHQLYYGSYRTIEINLMGNITNKEMIEEYAPNAFVQHENGVITMVLNINDSSASLERTFYHETSHMIDKVLEHHALYCEDALYSEEHWWSLNPDNFTAIQPETGGYYESYEIMPMEYFHESFTPYFASDYGKSFSTEDRATLFEAAMTGEILAAPARKKLDYYCQCIRDCFDTSDWPESTLWENAIH